MLALALVALVAGGAIAAYLLTRPAQVAVPTVVGEPLSLAKAQLANAGFSVGVTNVPDSHPAGTVIGQQPLGATKADKGSTVTLTVSQGPAPRAVPSVKGLSVPKAEREIRAAGLSPGRVVSQSSAAFPAGQVTGTDPMAGATDPVGTAVTIFVSSGKPSTGAPTTSVPDVTGQTQASAETQLQTAGFKVTTSTQSTSNVPAGNVISQSPPGGTNAPTGSTVNIVIAQSQTQTQAPTTAMVPGVVGSTASAASSALMGAGFQVHQSLKDVTKQSSDGKVLSQSPFPGSTAGKGSTVTIVVGHFKQPSPTTPTIPNPNPPPA